MGALNKTWLTMGSLLTSFTIAGFASQIGLLIAPMAAHFDISITDAAAQFSWFLGGVLIGNIAALVVLRTFKMQWIIVVSYSAVFLAMLAVHLAPSLSVASSALAIGGIASGIGMCAASTIIAAIWHDKQRGSVLVSQDALFNAGGMVLPFIVAILLSRNFAWSWGYLSVGCVCLGIVFLGLISDFSFSAQSAGKSTEKLQWHIGISVAGLGLLLTLICKLTPLIWLPVFLQDKFLITPEMAAAVISKIYLAGLIGSIVSSLIVLRLNIKVFIACAMILGVVGEVMFVLAPSMQWVSISAYIFGLAIAAIFHSFIAWGLTYVDKPDYRHVTFMYVCGGTGGTVAPYISSRIVEMYNIPAAFFFAAALYGIVFISVIFVSIVDWKTNSRNVSFTHQG